MVPSTAQELTSTLRQAELLSRQQATQLAQIAAHLADPQALAYALVQRGWLTSFQAEEALAGRAEGLVLGNYRLLEPLGSGGMGVVYKARQPRLDRTVALKVLRPDLVAQNPAAISRFRREARAVAQLSHPNIVVIYDAAESGPTTFIVMEYVDGPDLGWLVREHGPLPVTLACDFIRQAALGLQHAHDAGLVHRDIKPSNLLVVRRTPRSGLSNHGCMSWVMFTDSVIKILDMGLARQQSSHESTSLTHSGAMLGTPDFIAPEQARDASTADARADIYSLGGTFYYLLAGRPPFPEGTIIEKLVKHQIEQPQPIEQIRDDVPGAVLALIRRMMAKEPSKRITNCSDIAAQLADLLRLPAIHGLDTPPIAATSHDKPSVPEPSASLSGEVNVATGMATEVCPVYAVPSGAAQFAAVGPSVTVVTAQSLMGSAVPELPEAEVRIPAKKVAVLRAHSGPVMALAFSPDCRMLATGGLDRWLRLWYLGAPPRELAQLHEPLFGDLQRLAFAPSGKSIVTGAATFDARMWCWHWQQPKDRDRFPLEGCPSYSDALTFASDGVTVASAVGESIWLWTITADAPRKKSQLRTGGADVTSVSFSPDDSHIFTGHVNGLVQCWKAGWLGSRPVNTFDGHRDSITCMAISHDGALLASTARDHTVRIWDGTGASVKPRAVIPDVRGIVRQMMFLPDTQHLLTLSDSAQATLWTWHNGRKEFDWKLDQNIICSMALASDGGTVAIGCSDGSIVIYDLAPE